MTTVLAFDWSELKQAIRQNLEAHHRLYLFQGVVFIVLGTFCVLMPILAAEITVMILGAGILAAGISQAYFNYKGLRHHWGSYISTLISVGFGLAVLIWPGTGAVALATLIATFLVIKGISELFLAGAIAPHKGWGFVLLGGLVTLFLAALVWSGWPITSVWFLGVVTGINFTLFGFSLTNLSLNYKKFLKLNEKAS